MTALDKAVIRTIIALILAHFSIVSAQAQFPRDQIEKMQSLLNDVGYSAVRKSGELDAVTGLAQTHFCNLRSCDIDVVRTSQDLTPIIHALEGNSRLRADGSPPALELMKVSDQRDLDIKLVLDGQFLVTYDKNEIAIWETRTGIRRSALPVASFAPEPRGNLIADPEAGLVAVADPAMTVIDVRRGLVVGWVSAKIPKSGERWPSSFDRVHASFIPKTSRILLVRKDGAVVVADWKSGELVKTLREGDINSTAAMNDKNVVVSTDGKFGATISPGENYARVWDLTSNTQVGTVQGQARIWAAEGANDRVFVFSTYNPGKASETLIYSLANRQNISTPGGGCSKDDKFKAYSLGEIVVERSASVDNSRFAVHEKSADCSDRVLVDGDAVEICKNFDCESYTNVMDVARQTGLVAVKVKRTFALLHVEGAADKKPEVVFSPPNVASSGISRINDDLPLGVFSQAGELITVSSAYSRDRKIAVQDSGIDMALPLKDGSGWVATTSQGGLSDGGLVLVRGSLPQLKISLKDEKSGTGNWRLFLSDDGQTVFVLAPTTKSFGGLELISVQLPTMRVLRRTLISAVQNPPPSRNMQGALWSGSSATLLSGGQYLAVALSEPVVQVIDTRSGQRVKQISTMPNAMRHNGDTAKIAAEGANYSDAWVPMSLVSLGDRGLVAKFGWGGFHSMLAGLSGVTADVLSSPFNTISLGASYGQSATTPDGRLIVAFDTGKLAVVDLNSGKEGALIGRGIDARGLSLSQGGRNLAVLTQSGTIQIYDLESRLLLVSSTLFSDGEWFVVTPEGFFDASEGARRRLIIRTGSNTVTTVDSTFDSLYRPDLVREKLAGDPKGKVKAAASRLDLNQVMASGAAPKIAIGSPANGAMSPTDEITVEAAIIDQGGGIGKVEWRVNGVVVGLESRGFDRLAEGRPDTAGATQLVKRTLALERGENRIEVLAYNAKGLIASEPAGITVKWDGERTAAPPRLYVLSVGVNDYYDSRLRLAYAVPDATSLAEGLRRAGAGLYGSVELKTVLDDAVTLSNLDQVFADLGSKIQPRDVFVFFLAGHGKTKNGRYYFLPRDFRYEDENSIEKAGMDQEKFQAWFAKIPARKSVLLYDTCESGSLTGSTRGSDIDERLGALNRMARATGRTFLTATTDDAPALEGFRGHGVFTYALLDALANADVNHDGMIEVSELADYIDQKVPDYSFEAFKLRQIPQRSIVGNNFPLANRIDVLSVQPDGLRAAPAQPAGANAKAVEAVSQPPGGSPGRPTHVVIAPADVYGDFANTSMKVETLAPGTMVTLVKAEQGWALVARDGKAIGYVADSKLARVQ